MYTAIARTTKISEIFKIIEIFRILEGEVGWGFPSYRPNISSLS
jgi:hypothetical protein